MKLIFIIVIGTCYLFSQEKEVKPEQKPFDLPEAIIYGSDQLNVKSGFKRSPTSIPKLTVRELDSLNSIEKIRPSVLPSSTLPFIKNDRIVEKGYVMADLGRFLTSNLEAGYATSISDFDLYLNGKYEQSRGHTDNAQYSKIEGNFYSDYIASDKYFIFGGSKTRTKLHFEDFNYTNYSVSNFESRNKVNLGANVDVDGFYEGFVFNTGAGFDVMNTTGDSLDYSDRSVNGYLKVQNPYNKYNLGFNVAVDLRSGNGIGNNYAIAEGFASLKQSIFDMKLNVGYQIAEYFNGVRNGLKFDFNLNSNISNRFTLTARVSSGLESNFVSKLNNMNRFINYDIDIDHSYNKLLINSQLTYHKDLDFYSSVGFTYGMLGRNINFVNVDSSYFKPIYLDVNKLTLNFDGYYNINEKSSLNYTIKYNSVITDTLNNMNTYIPQIETEVSYNIKFDNGLSSKVSLEYVGKRFADLENKIVLDPFFNMNLEFNYLLNKNLTIFANIQNLFNQDIYLYNFYIERRFFGNIGVNYNF